MKNFLIIDGNSIACRAAFAKPTLTNSKGRETGGPYRFVTMLDNAMKMIRATHVVVAWDVGRDNFRTQIDDTYKANRETKSSELYYQFEDIKKILTNLGIKHIGIQGYEADDIIGTFVSQNEADNVYIFTGDKDSFQLIDSKTSVLYPLTGTSDIRIYDIEKFEEEYDIKINQFVELKALMGDGSDNIKGVNKCGQKTAVKWLKKYGTLDNLILNAHEITGKIGESLREWIPEADKTLQLVTICRTVPLNLSWEECELKLNWDNCLEIFEELEFKSLIRRIQNKDFYTK
jgi:5''-3'' exonuclease (including N-terminal domain of PolI)